MANKLKPCPFCNAKASRKKHLAGTDETYFMFLHEDDCWFGKLQSTTVYEDEIPMWNRRAK